MLAAIVFEQQNPLEGSTVCFTCMVRRATVAIAPPCAAVWLPCPTLFFGLLTCPSPASSFVFNPFFGIDFAAELANWVAHRLTPTPCWNAPNIAAIVATGTFDLSEIEQELAATNNHKEVVDRVREIFGNPKLRDIDRVRLVMIYALRYVT
jgi:hypothetical protein